MVVASLSHIAAILPVFLLGALSVLLRVDLGFDESGLGAALGILYAASALSAIPGGRVADALGSTKAMRLAAAMTASALVAAGLFAQSWATLVLTLVPAGVASGIAIPASTLAVARRIPPARQGLALGIKQAAAPMSTLLAGLAVPLIAVTFGWRQAFFAGAAVGGAVLVVCLDDRPPARGTSAPSRRGRPGDMPLLPMVVLATAVACGSAGAISLGSFLVEFAVSAGFTPGTAGLLLALSSVLAISVRVFVGWLADNRTGGHLSFVAGMLLTGALGLLVLALGSDNRALLVTGTAIAFGAGWGWPGVFYFAIVRGNPVAPAAATGIIQAGAATGGIAGPFLFGLVVAHLGFRTAWLIAAGLAVSSAFLSLLGRRLAVRRLAGDRR